MRYLSVCSGIEAATQAWHPLGWLPAAFAEVEAFPSAVLAHHYGSNMPGETLARNGVPNLGDMTRFREWPDYAIDLLVGGTPCQDYSVAGLRAGMAGARGGLTLTYVEIAARYRPDWLVWENVPGVLSSNNGRDFARFLGDLSGRAISVPPGGWQNAGIIPGIADAYGLAYRVLDAQFVRTRRHPWAVPQRRRRVFVVGHLGDWRRAAAVLFDRESLSGHPPPRREAGQRPAPTLAARTRGGGRLGTDFDLDGGLIPSHDAAQPLLAKSNISHRADAESYVAVANSGDVGYCLTVAGQQSLDAETETLIAVAPTLRAGGNATGGDRPYGTDVDTCDSLIPVAIQERAVSENPDAGPDGVGVRQDGAAYTLEARQVPPAVQEVGRSAGGKGQSEHAAWAVRRLTPREAERLMGLPDGYTDIPWRGKPGAPDGPRYKALGNSMAVNVMEWIGERIALVEALDAEMKVAAE